MMLDELGEKEAARSIERAVTSVTTTKIKNMGAGKMGYATTAVGDFVAEAIGKDINS